MKQSCTIKKRTDFSEMDFSCLFLLYYPLIGKEASILYGVLRSLIGQVEVEQIRTLTGFNQARLMHARKMLEQFELLNTYHNPQDQSWIYELQSPLSAVEFLRHDTFSRLYLQQVGSRQFDMVKVLLQKEEDIPTGYQNVSESVDISPLSSWDQEKEITYEKIRPNSQKTLRMSQFDFETFLKGMEHIFPNQLRTEENLARIAQLADIHGISALEMRRYVMLSVHTRTHAFDFEKLKGYVYKNQKVIEQPKNSYDMSPVKFLQNLQKGAPVSKADKNLIESLSLEYGFENDVINVLIEYTLEQTDHKFPRSYVEKVAATWARLNVHDVDSALAQTKKVSTKKQATNKVPEWYSDTQTHQASDELVAKALEVQKKRKGKNDGEN